MSEDQTNTSQEAGPISLEVKGLIVDPSSPNTPIVILKEVGGTRFLPIWIGLFEANAIAFKLDDVEPPRPMSHDLMANLVRELGATVRRIIVSDLIENTFYAQIILDVGGQERIIDSRPSDAIALALRFDAEIFATQAVFSKAKVSDLVEKVQDEEQIREWLESVDPEDLGKYTM